MSFRLTRRRFAFWMGLGLFTLGEKLRANVLDDLAVAAMGDTPPKPRWPVHWTAAENRTWRWFDRETYIDGQWKLTGRTIPIHKNTGKVYSKASGYLDPSAVPEDVQRGARKNTTDTITKPGQASPIRRTRHGRPPSRWLRSLYAEELRTWLKTINVPEAGVEGMTYWEHLTHDHSFAPKKIKGLTIPEQALLHAAAHYGY